MPPFGRGDGASSGVQDNDLAARNQDDADGIGVEGERPGFERKVGEAGCRPGGELDAPALSRLAAHVFRDTFAEHNDPADIERYLADAFTPQRNPYVSIRWKQYVLDSGAWRKIQLTEDPIV